MLIESTASSSLSGPAEIDMLEACEKREPAQIRRLLDALADTRALVSAQPVPGGGLFPTAVLAVRDDGHLLLDGHPDARLTRRATEARHVICVAQLDRIRIQFRLGPLRAVDEGGLSAFLAPLPDAVLELQRRDSFRLQIPPMHPVHCNVPRDDDAPDRLRVADLSAGGLALLATPEDPRFPLRACLPGCALLLPDQDPIPVALTVAHHRIESSPSGERLRIGCRFEGLPPAAERTILHYMFRIERQRSARERRAV